jgi:hypothetical protein
VTETGIGIIFPRVFAPVGVGVGVFVLGARVSLAETWMALAARIIRTSTKTKAVRNIFFCIEIPLFQSGWVANYCSKLKGACSSPDFKSPALAFILCYPIWKSQNIQSDFVPI